MVAVNFRAITYASRITDGVCVGNCGAKKGAKAERYGTNLGEEHFVIYSGCLMEDATGMLCAKVRPSVLYLHETG